MKVNRKTREKPEAQLLEQATNQLLRAVKERMVKRKAGVDYDKLRKDGYSDRFLTRLDEA